MTISRSSLPGLDQVLRRAHLSVALIAVISSGLTLTLAGIYALQAYATQNMQLVARSLSYTVEAAVVFNDALAVQEALDRVGKREDVAEIRVVGRSGMPLASWKRRETGPFVQLENWLASIVMPEPYYYPVTHDNITIGRIRLVPHSRLLVQYLMTGVASVLACMAFSTLLALAFSRRMHAGISGPLSKLADTAHRVRQYRSFGLRAPAADIAELDQLNQDFNALMDELATWQRHVEREHDTLAYRANHDSLTGLCNRGLLESELEHAVRDARFHNNSIALMFMDGDHFKEINDTYGHGAGDEVLKIMALRISGQLRESDIVARLGGDEFAALLKPIKHPEDAVHIAEKIAIQMQSPITLPSGEKVTSSVTIGIALYPDHARTAQELLAAADEAMYRAKDQERGSWAMGL
ncbi:diguanylate cyclase domain-containing protein [Methylovorus mays]|uniref:diguanylate cyclase domain-containing protein n=1 Tax=Methylovorus mays TaxID=184077 RepID=UPI001E2F1C37|nr:diguanylate cyclase [Methylovorus mays]MCB5205792.1 diguanylate cyclase [Methylovorus mays]